MSSELAAGLIAALEAISRDHPNRLLRLRGCLPAHAEPNGSEPFELLIYRGFSSSTTHAIAVDPDQPVLPVPLTGLEGELLMAPLDPEAHQLLVGPAPLDRFLDPCLWQGSAPQQG